MQDSVAYIHGSLTPLFFNNLLDVVHFGLVVFVTNALNLNYTATAISSMKVNYKYVLLFISNVSLIY